jgi:hypothetical protein
MRSWKKPRMARWARRTNTETGDQGLETGRIRTPIPQLLRHSQALGGVAQIELLIDRAAQALDCVPDIGE